MTAVNRGKLLTLTLVALGTAVAGTVFCVVQIYRTAQLPTGDGSGMQWVILGPLSLLFVFIVVPALGIARRGLRFLRTSEPVGLSRVLPGRGWLIALGLLVLYFLAPFIIAPILELFTAE